MCIRDSYRDGLNGGRDMRSFAGFYLILRYLPAFSGLFHKLHIADWLYRGYLFSIAALLIAFAKPYKEKYMNVLDTLLLAHLSIVCHLLTRNRFSGEGTQTLIITLIPALLFGLLPFLKLFKMIKNTATIRKYMFGLSLIHISEPTRRYAISYAVFCLKKKKIE